MESVECKVCLKIIKSGEERYVCSECKYQSVCLDCHPITLMDKSVHPDIAPLPHISNIEIYTENEIYNNTLSFKNDFSELMLNSFKSFSDRRCIGYLSPESNFEKSDIFINWYTYKEVMEKSFKVGTYLLNNIPMFSCVGMYLPNIPEWYFADLGCLWYGMTAVSFHHQSNKENLFSTMKNSDVSAIFVNQKTFGNLVEIIGVQSKFQFDFEISLKIVVYIGNDCDPKFIKMLPSNFKLVFLSDLLSIDKSVILDPVGSVDGQRNVLSIAYSSGATGDPKGVVSLDLDFSRYINDRKLPYPRVEISHAPIAHIQRRVDLNNFRYGGRVVLYSSDFENIFSLARNVRPHFINGAPRIWKIIYSNYRLALKEYAEEQRDLSMEQCVENVNKNFRNIFGDRVGKIVVYSAAVSETILTFIKNLWGELVVNLYGSTETMIMALNDIVYQNVEYRLLPIPELGFSPDDKPFPRGEIIIKSIYLFNRYYKNPEITNTAIKDGWYYTGDIVEEYAPRRIRVIDRKKNSFKLSNGEFVCAEFIEKVFTGSPLIKNIFVYGDTSQSFLVAIIIPSEEAIRKLDPKSSSYPIKENNQLKRIIMEEIDKLAQLNKSANYEIPKMILLDDTEWTTDSGLLTSTSKLSRPKLSKYYKSMINYMYDTLDSIQVGLISESKDKKEEVLFKYLYHVLGLDVENNSKVDLSKFSFSQIGGDSVAAIKLSNILKEKVKIDIKPQQILDKNTTLGEIFNNSMSTIKLNWEDEMKLDESIQINEKPIKYNNFKNIFLTGATGYNGSFLLYDLLKNRNCSKVYCLIRGTMSREYAKNKLANVIRVTNKLLLKHHEIEKIHPILGDLELPMFGMEVSHFTNLSNEIDLIIHNGALVHLMNPYSNMKLANVNGTEEVLRLATIGNNIIPVSHVSTIGTYHRFEQAIRDDREPNLKNLDEMSGYAQSKLISEQLIHKAFERGIPVIISRPGVIYSHSETGVDNSNDMIRLVISGIMHLGYYPDLSSAPSHLLNLSPVDWVSSSITKLSLNRDWKSKTNYTPTFLLTNQNSVDFNDFCESISKTYNLEKLDFLQWSNTLLSNSNNPLQPIFKGFNGIIPTVSKYNIDNSNTTKEIMKCGGDPCPVIDDKIIHNNIIHLKKVLNLK